MPGLNGLEVFERIRQVDAGNSGAHPEFVQRILRPVAEKRHRRLLSGKKPISEICARIAAVWQRHASGKTNDSAGETVLGSRSSPHSTPTVYAAYRSQHHSPDRRIRRSAGTLMPSAPAMPCSHRYLPATLAQRQQKQNHFTTKLYLSIAETAHCRPCPAHRQPLQ